METNQTELEKFLNDVCSGGRYTHTPLESPWFQIARVYDCVTHQTATVYRNSVGEVRIRTDWLIVKFREWKRNQFREVETKCS